MANQVIKKDGTKEAFDENKIRMAIEMAAKEGGLAEDRVKAVVDQVAGAALEMIAGKEEIATSEIGAFVLLKLTEVEPAAVEAWKKHEAAKAQV